MADEQRPPFVRFDRRAVEDRDASLKEGHYVGKDVDFAIITPVGSRDTLEREVKSWFDYLEEGTKQDRIPGSWLPAYRRAYEDWKEGRETPEEGTSIANWPVASPAQIRTCQDIGVATVEHLAQANEETVGRIGMGGRALKQKAIEYLEVAKSHGKATETQNKLRVDNKALEAENEKLRKQVEELKAKLAEREDA